MTATDPFGAKTTLSSLGGTFSIYDLNKLSSIGPLDRLPFSIKVLLESTLRNLDNFVVNQADVVRLVNWNAPAPENCEVPFKVARVILQDFTGVPCVVDLAAMRDAMKKAGGDPQRINPLVPVDLVIDHSVQVDEYANPLALFHNAEKEFERNRERYEFLKWGQHAFDNFGVVPPSTGIVHQVNLEYLAKVVWVRDGVAFPDTLVGTDSHTTMVNGLGVVGWGVGGIEAEACMLGQPIYIVTPKVVGFKVTGRAKEGVTATDVVLYVTQILRKKGVVEKFVEFFGPGLASMTLSDRATIANMAPEYGATIGFFPVDEQTLAYLRLTGRDENQVDLVERYCKHQGLWRDETSAATYSEVVELDLASVTPSLAGPKRPQDRVELKGMRKSYLASFPDAKPGGRTAKLPANTATVGTGGVGSSNAVLSGTTTSGAASRNGTATAANGSSHLTPDGLPLPGTVPPVSLVPVEQASGTLAAAVPPTNSQHSGSASLGVTASAAGSDNALSRNIVSSDALTHGDVVIAAITSCTNTSNPGVMVAAGLVAKKAFERGLTVKDYVKTSLAPGSRVVTDYFDKSGLSKYLDAMGFNTVGYGCTTCIGNSGPLPERISSAVEAENLTVCSVLSGNRNFEGRVNPHVKANYLASPPLVVAFAIAGTVNIDLSTEPIGKGSDGGDVFLKDIWPTQQEVDQTIAACVEPGMFTGQYAGVGDKNPAWNAIPVRGGELFDWDDSSTYIQNPPFFDNLMTADLSIKPIKNARVLVMVGDSVTTDHISPAGNIRKDSPAGAYLTNHGVEVRDYNQYGARRGADQVMLRGTFANIRLKNELAPGTEGGLTTYLPSGVVEPIYDASVKYRSDKTPLIVLAGEDYGMGSSRDWAAKGTMLLGVKAVIAQSFERIHRSNLVGMGVLPLVYKPGQTRASLKLTGKEAITIELDDNLKVGQDVVVRADEKVFVTTCRIDTPVELEYYRNGGILQTVLRKMMAS